MLKNTCKSEQRILIGETSFFAAVERARGIVGQREFLVKRGDAIIYKGSIAETRTNKKPKYNPKTLTQARQQRYPDIQEKRCKQSR